MKGQEGKAFKLLCSNGIAKINQETVDVLKDLHPQRTSDIKCPSSVKEQVVVDQETIAKKLFLSAADFALSRDVFGWAPWMLYSVRGERNGFFDTYVKFACLLTNLICSLVCVESFCQQGL